ncbi:TRAP transporter permease [Pseudooceanicola nanhaiensis]|uniref:TRAP transporter permease n=1 Tax=Pseudooceanicola nanhaiensis TaxID=375761 RepID=UPI001CD2B405|nr:TRAP transporter fused permease subunit [Pseudooceanicola nanhaiensis]MCA0921452.1 TRAP transporter fused permease subunit [Pseudooceanicola nanhaiensis]
MMRRLRKFVLGISVLMLPVIGVLWILNVPQLLGFALVTQQIVGLMLGFAVAVAFLHHPYCEKSAGLDLILALAGAACWFWYALNFKEWMVTMAFRPPEIWVPGIFALLLLAEALRKSMGIAIAILVWLVTVYGFFGDLVPGMLQASVFAPTRTVIYLYADSNGVPGLVITVIITIVLPFMVFGKVMEVAQGMSFFNGLALAAVGRRRGGPAKVAIVASGFFGMMSGSTVANIMSTGIFTIPMMIRTGMTRTQAAAIEAVASNGGQVAPPIMGATAFIMAEVLQVPYSSILVAAAVPAALYYLVLFFNADAMAVTNGLKGLEEHEIPSFKETMKEGGEILISIGVLLYLLFATGYNPGLCALIASASMLVIYGIRIRFRFDGPELLAAVRSLGEEVVPLVLIGGAAGVIIGLLNSTGFAFQLSVTLTHLATEYGLFALLLLSGLVAIVLGMGMPTAAVYIVLATVVAPTMVKLGVAPMGAHLFLLYFGLMSMVTPPIAFGSIVAARLAQANMWRTGFLAMRISLPAFVLPFVWVYNPAALLDGTALEIAIVLSNGLVASLLLKQSMLGSPVRQVPGWLCSAALTVLALLTMGATALTGPTSPWAVAASVAAAAVATLFARALRRRQAGQGEAAYPQVTPQ